MLNHISLKNVVFVDIETVPLYENYGAMPEVFRELWDKKAATLARDAQTPVEIYQRAGIYAEFGRVVCISMGFFVEKGGKSTFRVKSFYGDDEVEILKGFAQVLRKFTSKKGTYICAHNGKEFDLPFIARRMIVNGLELPSILDVAGKKPWEVPFLDTLELWKFGDYKHYTSLHLLTTILNIPTPKDDIDGSMVADVYYNEKDVKRIAAYCEKDVVAVAQIMQRYKGEAILDRENVEVVA